MERYSETNNYINKTFRYGASPRGAPFVSSFKKKREGSESYANQRLYDVFALLPC